MGKAERNEIEAERMMHKVTRAHIHIHRRLRAQTGTQAHRDKEHSMRARTGMHACEHPQPTGIDRQAPSHTYRRTLE